MTTSQKYRIVVSLDFWIQSAMFVAVAGSLLKGSPFFALILAIPIGVWQVLNGFVYLFAFKKNNRKPYLIGAAVCSLLFVISIQHGSLGSLEMFLMFVLAIWNYLLTLGDFID